jgi:hypothetical protein
MIYYQLHRVSSLWARFALVFAPIAISGGALLFCLSFVLLVWPALRLSERLASTAAERFWLFVGAIMLQLGTIPSLTSAIHQLHPAGWILTQAVICIIVVYFTGGLGPIDLSQRGQRWRESYVRLRAFVVSLSPGALAVLMCSCGLIILSGISQLATPINIWDDRMYHASRVLYWIQHRSVFPYISHNDRQTVSPFGSELFLLWPVLLTRAESIGRMVFWSAYPGVAIGQYWLLRSVRLSRGLALLGGLILLSTPLVADSAIGLRPEIWAVMALLGTAYWAVAICMNPERIEAKCFFLGLFAIVSVNTRPTALALLPSIAIIPFCARTAVRPLLRLRGLSSGLLCGAVLSSLIIPLGFNFARYHNPFGAAALRHVVGADISPIQLYTHAVRLPFLLLELPDVAVPPSVLARLDAVGNQTISALGAGAPLPLEDKVTWQGKFSYRLPERATRFSIWGVLWIPVLGFAVWLLRREVQVTWPEVNLTAIPTLTLLAVPLFVAVLFGTRWMANSAVPDRFLIGPYALMLPIAMALAGTYVSGRKLREAVALLVVVFGVYQPLRAEIHDAVHSVVSPITPDKVDEPFQEALDSIPDGAHILFVGNQDAPDYPLFSPRAHYANSVTSWGKTPFDAGRMQSLIQSEQITHVLLQDDQRVRFYWDPPVSTSEMVAWLSYQPDIREVPLSTPHMRLYQTACNILSNEKPYKTTAAPPSAPLIFVENRLQSQVGIDPTFLKTPWPVETLEGSPGGFLWMGEGPPEGVEFGVWSRETRTVDFRFNVTAGPSRSDVDRTVSLLQDGVSVADRSFFRRDASLVIAVELHAGRNLMHFYSQDAPTVKIMPNGDTRHLIVLLHKVIVDSVSAGGNR